jgi:hypothetical protein
MTRTSLRATVVLILLLGTALFTTVVQRPGPVLAAGAHPRLLFSAADIPTLQARVATPEGARSWATLKERLDAFVDSPNAWKWHLDPSTIGTRNSDGTVGAYGGQNQMPAMLTDLAFGYVITGDTKYSTPVIESLKQLAAARWPYWSDTTQYLGLGDLLRGVGLSFDWTYSAMTSADVTTIVSGLSNHLTVGPLVGLRPLDVATTTLCCAAGAGSNWAGVTAGGAGLAMLAISGETGAPSDLTTLLNAAETRVNTYLGQGVGVDGEGGEGFNYTNYGMHGALPFAFALKRSGGTDLVAAHPGLTHLPDYIASMLIPGPTFDGTVPLNDSERDTLGDELIEQLWQVSPTTLQSWVWEHTLGPAGVDRYKAGRSPMWLPSHNCLEPATNPAIYAIGCGASNAEELNLIYSQHSALTATDPSTSIASAIHFRDHGIVTGRTGWSAGAGDVVSTFSASRGPAGHTQEDIGQFTLYGYGGDFALDSGYGHAYGCHKSLPHPSAVPPQVPSALPDHPNCHPNDVNDAGTAGGHNVVLVGNNGGSQSGARPNTTSPPTIEDYLARGDLAFAHANTAVQFPADPVLATRDWMFAHVPGMPVLVAIGDQLNKDGVGRGYDWQLHTSDQNVVVPHANGFTVTAPSGAVLQGLSTRNGVLADSVGTPFIVEPFAGSPFNRPVSQSVLLQTDGLRRPAMDGLTVMALTPAGMVPAVVQRVEVPGGNAVESTSGSTKTVVLKRLAGSTGAMNGLGFTLDGAFGYAVAGMGEAVLDRGTSLKAYGIDYVTVTGGSASVLVSAGKVQATGPAGAAYKVYSPSGIPSVTVNGAAVTPAAAGSGYYTF